MFENYDYNYEESRKYAFCIYNGKLYKSDLHFECLLDILEEKGLNRDKLFHRDDSELIKMINDSVVMGEIASIKGNKITLLLNKEDKELTSNYFNNPTYLYTRGKLKLI